VRNWKRLRFPKVTVQYGDPISFEQVESPTREQAQAVADQVFAEVQRLYYGLHRNGRRRAIRAARAARRRTPDAGAARTSTAS